MRNISYEEALRFWNDRSNGRDDGHSPSKGGLAWLDGEHAEGLEGFYDEDGKRI